MTMAAPQSPNSRRWQFGVRTCLWVQFAVAPLFLGLSWYPQPARRPSEWVMLVILYLFPALYAAALAAAFAPQSPPAESTVIRRATWGLLFGVVYCILFLAAPVAFLLWQTYSHRPFDRWDIRNLQVLLISALCYTAISALSGSVAAGTWVAIARWASHRLRQKRDGC